VVDRLAWDDAGFRRAVEEQAARDDGLPGNADQYVSFYHDGLRQLAEEAMRKQRARTIRAIAGPCLRIRLSTNGLSTAAPRSMYGLGRPCTRQKRKD
jgi:hypothetical protein